MRERRYGDVWVRSRSPLQPQGRVHSPLASRRHGKVTPPSHRHHGVQEPSSRNSRYLSGHSRADCELSRPIRRHGNHSQSPPARHHWLDHSPPQYRLAAKEPVQSQPFTDTHGASNSLGLSSDRRREGLGWKDYERRQYEEDRFRDGYRDPSLRNKIGLDEHSSFRDSASTKFQWKHLLDEKQPAADIKLSHRTSMGEGISRGGEVSEIEAGLKPTSMTDDNSVRNRNFPGYIGSSTVAVDKYGFYDGNSVAGLGLEGDGTWNYDNFSAREQSREEARLKSVYVDDLPNLALTRHIHAPVNPYVSTDSFSGYREGTVRDEYGQMPPVRSGYKELLDSSPVVRSQMENVGHEFACTRERRNVGSDFGSLPDKRYYENLSSVREKYGLQGTFKTSPEVHLADRVEVAEDSGGEFYRGSRLLDDQHHVSGVSRMEVQDEQYEAGATHFKRSREDHLDYEPYHFVEDDGFVKGDGFGPYGDSFNSISLSERGEGLPDADWNSQHRLTGEELGSVSPSEKIVKQKHGFDKRRLTYNLCASRIRYGDDRRINENANSFYGRLKHGRFLRTYSSQSNKRHAIPEDYLSSDEASMTMKRNWRQSVSPAVKDIKNRLGPSPSYARMPYPWVKRTFLGQATRNGHVSHGSEGDESLETTADGFESHGNHNLDAAKAEPPEDTEEFTQLVNGAFLKFVKLLNENTAQRRKYKDQGQSGILKCGVCGRKSKDYIDTQSLAMHAFATRATGFHAEHLGLHKALCILMGWNHAVGSNGTWVRQELPAADAFALREDLIIWPPIVIIHNSSIASPSPDERVILGPEEMQAILREMGFGRDKTKVVRGKPANQSIMVASFYGTFSGLFEAESLHKHFIEKGQGRIEFDRSSSIRKRIQGTGKAPEDKVSVLYGYLGIAEDLDKLDFEMKKRCVVKSRKEIQEIVDVQL